jgi:hypothetical protein
MSDSEIIDVLGGGGASAHSRKYRFFEVVAHVI